MLLASKNIYLLLTLCCQCRLISRHVDSAAKSLASYIIHDTQFRKSSSGSYSEGKSTGSWTLGRLTVAGGVAAGFGLLYGWSREHKGTCPVSLYQRFSSFES